jgi:glycerol uptake facilitator-like aquaporin
MGIAVMTLAEEDMTPEIIGVVAALVFAAVVFGVVFLIVRKARGQSGDGRRSPESRTRTARLFLSLGIAAVLTGFVWRLLDRTQDAHDAFANHLIRFVLFGLGVAAIILGSILEYRARQPGNSKTPNDGK